MWWCIAPPQCPVKYNKGRLTPPLIVFKTNMGLAFGCQPIFVDVFLCYLPTSDYSIGTAGRKGEQPRAPLFAFKFSGELFQLEAREPQFTELFQLPPRMQRTTFLRNRKSVLPEKNYLWLVLKHNTRITTQLFVRIVLNNYAKNISIGRLKVYLY